MAQKKHKRGSGEGCITQRADGTWAAVITTGTDEDGKQKRRFFYGKTRKEVADKLNKALGDINSGLYVDPSKIRLKDWLNTWLWEYKSHNIKPKTLESYEGLIRTCISPILGHLYLQELKPVHVQNMVKVLLEKELSPRTVKYCHTLLHSALEVALQNNLIIKNICQHTVLPKQQEREIKVLTVEQQNKLIAALNNHRLQAAFIVLLSTGIRIGELLALQWDTNVDLNEGMIKVTQNLQRIKVFDEDSETKSKLIFGSPKTEKGKRVIPLLDDVVAILKLHKQRQNAEKELAEGIYEDNGLVFCTEIGTPLEPSNFRRLFSRILNEAGIPEINIHALRHTFATRGLENGIELKVMQELLGHASISMTGDIYSHVLPDKKRESINKLKGVFNII